MSKSKAEFNAIRSLGFASISGTYADIGTPTSDKVCCFRIINSTDGDMFFSLDGGLTDHFFLPAGTFVLYDVRSNQKKVASDDFVLPIGTQFAVKQSTAATEKSVYVECMF